uniref:Repressor of RNA polymerase III transcription MAF1 homolog n=1 Tax=Trichuris muris TaxID=70415 RepID=A0A5S6QKS9_TRIMR
MVLFYLIETLNVCFLDYAFFNTSGRKFSKAPSIAHFMQSVDARLLLSVVNYNSFEVHLWAAIDVEIDLKDCVAFSYLPGSNGDLFTEPGCVWSFNNIVYNRRLKRILFFFFVSSCGSSICGAGRGRLQLAMGFGRLSCGGRLDVQPSFLSFVHQQHLRRSHNFRDRESALR